VQPNGPYLVEGGVRLVRKSIVYSEHGEPLTWRVDAVIPTGETYKLCRCGHSRHKPFCDDSHLRVGFDGTETADTGTRASRAHAFPGTRIVMEDDASLCADAGFCGNRIEKVWNLIERTEESLVRFQLMSMCERCPSGRLTYRIDGQIVEPDLPQEIAVYADGPIWVTGGIPVERSDGKPFETRNRMTLCRCGHSNNKPLCDSTHAEVDWKEAVNDPEEQPAPR
jgi:CDGSH-type Zn-finger protein